MAPQFDQRKEREEERVSFIIYYFCLFNHYKIILWVGGQIALTTDKETRTFKSETLRMERKGKERVRKVVISYLCEKRKALGVNPFTFNPIPTD